MRLQTLIQAILVRELRSLQRELEAYPDETEIWSLPAGIGNSAGTLALHLVGNLQAFVGATLGDSGYRRDRPAEFSRRHVARQEIVQEIQRTVNIVESTLSRLPDDVAADDFPLSFGETRVETADFLVHLVSHLAFHLGQIDYHRRLTTGENRSVGPLPIVELASA